MSGGGTTLVAELAQKPAMVGAVVAAIVATLNFAAFPLQEGMGRLSVPSRQRTGDSDSDDQVVLGVAEGRRLYALGARLMVHGSMRWSGL